MRQSPPSRFERRAAGGAGDAVRPGASTPRVSRTQPRTPRSCPRRWPESLPRRRIWVASRSRNQRSWKLTTAQPAKSVSASSTALGVSTSRSLVGSSSSSRFPPGRRSFARWTRLRSPPERSPTRFCWSLPLKLNHETYWRELTSRLPSSIVSWPPEISFHAVLGCQVGAGLVDIRDLHRLADPELPVVGLFLARDHPKERRLARAVRADHADDSAGRRVKLRSSTSSRSP